MAREMRLILEAEASFSSGACWRVRSRRSGRWATLQDLRCAGCGGRLSQHLTAEEIYRQTFTFSTVSSPFWRDMNGDWSQEMGLGLAL